MGRKFCYCIVYILFKFMGRKFRYCIVHIPFSSWAGNFVIVLCIYLLVHRQQVLLLYCVYIFKFMGRNVIVYIHLSSGYCLLFISISPNRCSCVRVTISKIICVLHCVLNWVLFLFQFLDLKFEIHGFHRK